MVVPLTFAKLRSSRSYIPTNYAPKPALSALHHLTPRIPTPLFQLAQSTMSGTDAIRTTPISTTTSPSPSPAPTPIPLCTVITPVGMLGYGLSTPHSAAALSLAQSTHPTTPIALILDSGSTDSGPEKLALGTMSVPREAYKRDLWKLVRLSREYGVKVVFSSAGGSGTDECVGAMVDVVEEISAEEGIKLQIVAVYSNICKSFVTQRLGDGMIVGCGRYVPALTQEKVDKTSVIMAQIGPEPILDAMQRYPDFDVLVVGRSYDPAPYIAYAAWVSNTPLTPISTSSSDWNRLLGGLVHAGKILECGGLCAVPKSNGAMATIYSDGSFVVRPTDPGSRCTSISVAVHTLYEKSRPDVLLGPGGYLDLSGMKTQQLDDGKSVRVSGGVFCSSRDDGGGLGYTVKLEGAEVVGYRSMMMGRFGDCELSIPCVAEVLTSDRYID